MSNKKKSYDLTLKGTVGYWNFNRDMVDDIVAKNSEQEIHVLIDSLGGRVDDALSISSAFAQHGNVHVHYRGMNASAATIASMGAKRITIDSSAMYLVHQCSFTVFEWAALNADQLIEKAEEYKKLASDAEKIDLTIAELYAKRCKRDLGELQNLMRENKWLTAKEALEWGFVDEVEEVIEPIKLSASVATAMANEGMPVPENIEVEADGFFAMLEKVLSKAFKSFRKEGAPASVSKEVPSAEAQDPAQTSNQSTTQSLMKKTFVLVAAILAAVKSALPEADADGKYLLDEPALDALENALKDADQAKADKDAEIQSLKDQLAAKQTELDTANARITELEALPAAHDEQVVETGKQEPENEEKSPAEDLAATLAEARAMLGK